MSDDNRELLGKVLPSPFFSSFVGRAHEGDLRDTDSARRSAAWAHWAVRSTRSFSSASGRPYTGFILPGRFHDPLRSGPEVRPHLEVSESRLATADPSFPERLSQAGNAVLFPWWVYPEVTALRRALLGSGSGDVAFLSAALWRIRPSLADTLRAYTSRFASQWPRVEHALVVDLERVAPFVLEPFSEAEVNLLAPSLALSGVSVSFEPGLLQRSGVRSARRVGVWVMSFDGHSGVGALGVVTPRLTSNSIFRDRDFDAGCESPAALLVRLLLMRRLVGGVAGVRFSGEVVEEALRPSREAFIRSVVAVPGAKLPEASTASSIHFLQAFPVGDSAWELLERWSSTGGLVLTVSRQSFLSAHLNALRFLRRAEDPLRGDINTVLPLAWDSSGRVARATFVRAQQ